MQLVNCTLYRLTTQTVRSTYGSAMAGKNHDSRGRTVKLQAMDLEACGREGVSSTVRPPASTEAVCLMFWSSRRDHRQHVVRSFVDVSERSNYVYRCWALLVFSSLLERPAST